MAQLDIAPDLSGHRSLLVRRNNHTGELAYYRCYTPRPIPLQTLVTLAGHRWTVEENFLAGKGLTGLDHHQVRRWTSWHRATILSMLAHAFLAVTTATERTQRPSPTRWIRLTCNEIRHPFTAVLIAPIRDITHRLRCQPGDDNTNTARNDATTSDDSDATILTAKSPAQPNITNSGCRTSTNVQ